MGENTKNGIEALEFEDGKQWPVDLANMRRIDKRPTLTINLTRSMVRRVCNNMRQQRPRIKVHPVGDGARVEDAKIVGGLIRHIETLSNASVAYDTAGESAVKIGWGYARIIGEYVDEKSREQELKIRAIRNSFTVYDDPTTQLPTGQDRDWLLITEEMRRSTYKRKYPKATNAEWKRGGAGDNTRLWESKEKIRLAEYYRVKRTPEYLHYLNDGTTLFDKDWKRLKPSLEARGITLDIDPVTQEPLGRQSHRRTIEWYRLNGTQVVEKRVIPGKWIPVSRCLGNILDLNGQVRMRGMIADLMDSNRMLNYWATCETEIVALAPRAPYVAAEGQLDGHPEWKDANQKPYSALVYNIVHTNPDNLESPVLPAPQRVEGVQVPAGIVNARQSAKQDLMELAGMPHEPGRDTPGTVVSGVALRQRQALSDIGHFQYYDNQTMFISFLGEIMLDQIPYYYSEARMQRIIGEDGVPQMVKLNERVMDPQTQAIHEVKNNLTVGRFDVVMDTGPGYETKRQEGQEAVIDLLKTPLGEPIVKTGADIIVRNMDFAGADDLADRLLPTNKQGMDKAIQALPKEAQGIVMALQSQLQEAQQTIQHQAMEIKFKGDIEQGWMAVEREKMRTKSETDLHDTSINAQTKVFDTHVRSVTARDVAEIQAGATLLNTHTEAEHNKEAASIALKAAEKAESKSNGASNG